MKKPIELQRSKTIAATLTETDYKEVLRYCQQLNIERSLFVMLAIQEYLRKNEEYEKLTK
jgi:hypothetical protein